MTSKKIAIILGTAGLLFVANANAYLTFFGEDLNNSGSTPLSSIPNSSGAESSFLAQLIGVGTETFEAPDQTAGQTAPLVLTFPGVGTATLTGGNGIVSAVTPGTTNGVGRYSVPSATSSQFWEVSAGGTGNFSITFNNPVAALGFYGIDIGDFGGQLSLNLSNGDSFIVPNTIGSSGSTDGSVLYYGLIAQSAAEQFSSVDFLTTTGQGDVFAFDNVTIGSLAQVCGQPGTPACPTPEPASLALLAVGLGGLSLSLRRKKR